MSIVGLRQLLFCIVIINHNGAVLKRALDCKMHFHRSMAEKYSWEQITIVF